MIDGAEQDLEDPVGCHLRHQGMIYHFNCFKERWGGKWGRLRLFITVDGTDFEVRQMEIWIICRNRSYVRLLS